MTPKTLKLADNLALPLASVTETFAIIAKRRVGKSNLAVRMAEVMYDLGIPWCAIDPKGDWWGIRSSADGKRPGLSVIVFGGKHGDLPLSPDAGSYMADLIAQKRITCVLDVSQFTKGEQIRFLYAFATRLLAVNEEPLHLFFEECDDYIPQQAMNFKEPDARQLSEIMVVRAFSKLVRHGGFKGIGCTLITQRVALVSKNVLSQVETFFLLRTIEPLDITEVQKRVKAHPRSLEILESLPSLPVGSGWVYSPAFLELVDRIEIFDRRSTFDSGRTPKMGEKRVDPTRLAEVDLAAIRDAMESFVAEAKANDPAELRVRATRAEREVELLRGQIIELQDHPMISYQEKETIVEVVPDEVVAISRSLVRSLGGELDSIRIVTEQMDKLAREALDRVEELVKQRTVVGSEVRTIEGTGSAPITTPRPVRGRARVDTPSDTPRVNREDAGSGVLSKAQKQILTALAQYHPVPQRIERIAVLTGRKIAGHFENELRALKQKGCIEGVRSQLEITEVGFVALGPFDRLPTGKALIDYWVARLPKAEAEILTFLTDHYPDSYRTAQVAEATGRQVAGHFENSVRALTKRELIVRDRGILSASVDLMVS